MAVGESEGRFLYDMVLERLKAQAANQAALTGRAKDLIGLAAVATTITGVIANDKLVNVAKADLSTAFALLLTAGLILTLLAGIYSLVPRTWNLSPSPSNIAHLVSEQRTMTVDQYYASVANGFLVDDGRGSVLAKNDAALRNIGIAVVIQVFGVGLLAIAGLVLAWEATGVDLNV